MKEPTSKHIDGIADLVVVAPIKEGFIESFETITYASRLELTANALNRIRVAAREYERIVPFSDVTERILSLLDFRVGVIDKDLFGLVRKNEKPLSPHPKRYLYLTATFDGGFEPYMRQIWQPLGPFLDLLFCNCEGYVTATEHSFDEYIQWVRDNQMDSAIFYSTTGATVRDQKYLESLERMQRDRNPLYDDPGKPNAAARDLALATQTMSYPDDDAAQTRRKFPRKTLELGLEALAVLYKLADYYPPEWLTGTTVDGEGHRLLRVTKEIGQGLEVFFPLLEAAAKADPSGREACVLKTYAEPLNWYRTGLAYLAQIGSAEPNPDPQFDRCEVQDGILNSHGPKGTTAVAGAMMLFTVRNADLARQFIKSLVDDAFIAFASDGDAASDTALFGNIAFTPQGLIELGMHRETLDAFPKEFREGLAQRSGLVGDMRENHPRNWILPERNGPQFLGRAESGTRLPPVDMDEVDFVIQLRSSAADHEEVRGIARKIAEQADTAATLESVEWLHLKVDGEERRFRDHFDFADGISQPRPHLPGNAPSGQPRDQVALGEVLLGYGNDRGDGAPAPFGTLDGADKPEEMNTHWRDRFRRRALEFQKDGSFLVIRKIGEDVDSFNRWLMEHENSIAAQLGCTPDKARRTLKAAVMGRDEKGCPLVLPGILGENDFDYKGDRGGLACPHAAHIRRANPRRWDPDPQAPVEIRREFNRPTPRMTRRGMLFGRESDASRGIMFMAYVASLSEQYEVVQRWLNGGNPTDVASGNNDPLTGVQPKDGPVTFRFVARNSSGQDVVIRAPLPPPSGGPDQPGRHPFTPLYWGLYLFTPSRSALLRMTTKWTGGFKPLGELLEQAVGSEQIKRLRELEGEVRAGEWKRILEDFMTKDPSERDISPHVWSAIRYYAGGVLNLEGPVPIVSPASNGKGDGGDNRNPACSDRWRDPDWKKQNVILCAGAPQVMKVLADWENFTSEEQLRRILPNAGPIYVTQQPDDAYICLDGKHRYTDLNGKEHSQNLSYPDESAETNTALLAYPEDRAFLAGYLAGKKVLDERKANSVKINPDRTAFKLDMRREYFQPAIAEIWRTWYGLPDEETLFAGGWSWKRIVNTISSASAGAVGRDHALCPGDFMAPSRGSVFPRPNDAIKAFAQMHGTAILDAGRKFVARHRKNPNSVKTPLIEQLFKTTSDDEVLARNVIGTMIGAIPPMEANLRNILFEWLNTKRLWRHQAAFKQALAGKTVIEATVAARHALHRPVTQAMCIRPAPDMLFRTAKRETTIERYDKSKNELDLEDAVTREGDMVIVSLVSASQWALYKDPDAIGNVDIVFGGQRKTGSQGYTRGPEGVRPDAAGDDEFPVHACPAQKMAMGGMKGILAALLDAGTIQALPASLILRISDW